MDNPLNYITDSRLRQTTKVGSFPKTMFDPDLLVSPMLNWTVFSNLISPEVMKNPLDYINGSRLYNSIKNEVVVKVMLDPNLIITPLYNWSTYKTQASPKDMPNPLAQSSTPIVNVNFM